MFLFLKYNVDSLEFVMLLRHVQSIKSLNNFDFFKSNFLFSNPFFFIENQTFYFANLTFSTRFEHF